jgi:type II secretory pathway component GspD/PulD (secretin)
MRRAFVQGLCATLLTCCGAAPGFAGDEETPVADAPASVSETQCAVVFTKHIDCADAATHVRSLFQTDKEVNKATWFRPANAVLLRGTPDEVEQMKSLLTQIDVPPPPVKAAAPPKRELVVIPVKYADADELLDVVKRATGVFDPKPHRRHLSSSSRHGETPAAWYAVDDRTNVIVMSGTREQIDNVKGLIEKLDVPVDRAKSLENGDQGVAHEAGRARRVESRGG